MKKIRKAKVITALALTAVMLAAMTGIATANGYPSPDILPSDSSGYKDSFGADEDVYVIGQGAGDATYDVYVMDNQNYWYDGDSLSGYKAKITVTVSPSGIGFVGQPNLTWAGADTVPGEYDLVLDTNRNGDYDQGVDDVEDGMKIGFTVVPEFATIAIPVAAILGLVLFFNHRKRRKE